MYSKVPYCQPELIHGVVSGLYCGKDHHLNVDNLGGAKKCATSPTK